MFPKNYHFKLDRNKFDLSCKVPERTGRIFLFQVTKLLRIVSYITMSIDKMAVLTLENYIKFIQQKNLCY